MSGTNHVLPTGGTAKFYSALGVYDFIKHPAFSIIHRQYLQLTEEMRHEANTWEQHAHK